MRHILTALLESSYYLGERLSLWRTSCLMLFTGTKTSFRKCIPLSDAYDGPALGVI